MLLAHVLRIFRISFSFKLTKLAMVLVLFLTQVCVLYRDYSADPLGKLEQQ